jgi:type IV secretion system protein TrbJ
MTSRRLRSTLVAGATLVSASAALGHAHAQWIVFDPTNYSQNVLTAARTLQQVNNQIQSLENQAKMLVNQAKNLENLPYSSLTQLQQSISQTEQLLSQAQRVAYSVSSINQAFAQTYPQSYSGTTSFAQLVAGAQARWQNSLAGFQDAMRVQAGVVQNLDATRTQINALISSSQSASGALQAAQSGNQLIGLQTTQLADLTAVMAAIARAQSLEGELRLRLSAGLGPDVPLMSFTRWKSAHSVGGLGSLLSLCCSSSPPSASIAARISRCRCGRPLPCPPIPLAGSSRVAGPWASRRRTTPIARLLGRRTADGSLALPRLTHCRRLKRARRPPPPSRKGDSRHGRHGGHR